ncbi:hypothetical protein ALC56_00674 [Trachymyrmex septentrionalis]|uniref:Uncharacterized protein n=1 Tax=Trachymyrmex septentrionalis TaxID=34720 RepID=A0A195FXW4_9HYME|nr:hypothetical protein ALC56_00674 [Trachymyrmex septentrionalis]
MTKGIPALAFVRKPASPEDSLPSGCTPSGILDTSGRTTLSAMARAAAVHHAAVLHRSAFDKTELDEPCVPWNDNCKRRLYAQIVRFCDGHWKPIVDRSRYSAVGMAADSTDTSLLTSAIEEDPTESPNAAIHIGRSEILHLHCHHHHPRSKDVPRKCRRDQNGALLCDFDEVIDYVDYARLIRSWLSRTCNSAYKQREASLLKFVTDIPPNACSFGYEYIVHPR